MKKFQQNMNRELKRPYPDRRKLEAQCINAVAFGNANSAGPDADLLSCPVWIICINIVAIEMLRAKLPPSEYWFFYWMYKVQMFIFSHTGTK